MRILHVSESIKGGVGSYLNNLALPQSSKLGYDNVRFLVPSEHVSQLSEVRPQQVRTYARPDRSAKSLKALAISLASEVEAFKPDIIHAHSSFAGLLTRLMYGARRQSPAVVYCPHGWAFNAQAADWKRATFAVIERALSPLADAIVAISEHEMSSARHTGIPDPRLHLIRNGVPDLDQPVRGDDTWSDARLRVLFVGRLDRQKGADLLLEAAASMLSSISLRIVGEAVADGGEISIPSNTQVLGWLSPAGVQLQLASCDVVVIPSRWEGFGLVAIEAMRAGKPVIAADAGGLPEIVVDGCGILIPRESPGAIKDALLSMDQKRCRRMGVSARRRFLAEFTLEKMSAGLLKLYDTVCEDGAAAGDTSRHRLSFEKPLAPKEHTPAAT